MEAIVRDGTIVSSFEVIETSDEESVTDSDVDEDDIPTKIHEAEYISDVRDNENDGQTEVNMPVVKNASASSTSLTDTESDEDSFSDIYDAKEKLLTNSPDGETDKPISTSYKVIINNNGSAPIICNPDTVRCDNHQTKTSSHIGEKRDFEHKEESRENIKFTNLDNFKESESENTSLGQQTVPVIHIIDKEVSCCGFKYSLHEEIPISDDYHHHQGHPKRSFRVLFGRFIIVSLIIAALLTLYHFSTLSIESESSESEITVLNLKSEFDPQNPEDTAAPSILQIVDNASFSKACEEPPICVIAFLPHILDCQSSCRNSYIESLTKLADKYKKKSWGWLWSEAMAQPVLEEAVHVGGFRYPAMVVLSHKTMKYSTLTGSFGYNGINEFLRDVSYGKVRTSPVRGAAMLKVTKVEAWDGKDGKIPEEEEIDFSDEGPDDHDEL